MPKETIDTGRGTSENPPSKVILKWGKESSDAQLGVEFHEWFSFNKDLNKEEIPEYNSLWFDFESRQDINRMIRVLRKMRDDVFGKDE